MNRAHSSACSIIALDDYTADLLVLQFRQRESLPKAANGRPKAPSDHYAHSVLKDMQHLKSAEYRRLLATWITNLRDGVPLDVVKQPLRRMEAILDVESGHYTPRSLIAICRREQREQTLVDLSQFRVAQDENDPEALRQLEAELASYLAVAAEMMAETQRRIAYLQAGPIVPPTPATNDGRSHIVRLK